VSLERRWVINVLLLSACGDDPSATGGGGGGAAPVAECSDDYARWAVPGVRADQERRCVDVSAEEVRFIEVCRPNDESKYYPDLFFYCIREVATGEEYWINPIFWLVEPIPTEWEFCELPLDYNTSPETLPPPCFAQCPDTEIGFEEPFSTCTEEATRIVFACGGDSAWDENCCRRTPCSGVPCPEGFECRQVSLYTPSSFCWVGVAPDADPETVNLDDPAAGCGCLGAFNPPEKWCFPVGGP
jgi:hypothetical protein